MRLQPNETLVLVVRRHPWTVFKTLLWLPLVLLALPAFVALEYLAPGLDVARFSTVFLWLDLGFAALCVLKWLGVDVSSWLADSYVLTDQRVIEQRGVMTVERREANLRTIQETNYTIVGAGAHLFDYGDLRVQTGTRGSSIVFRQIAHPRRLQAVLATQSQAARDQYAQLQGQDSNAIQSALTRIFNGQSGSHDSRTLQIPRITRLTLRVQRRLSLLPEETVHLATRRHPILLWRATLPPMLLGAVAAGAVTGLGIAIQPILLLVALAAFLAWSAWGLIDWLDDLYVLTSDRIIELRRTPLVFELRNVMQLRSVHDVVLRVSSVGGRMFNMGTLTIELAGADPLCLVAVPHPERLQRLIFEGLESAVQRDKLRDQERLAGTLTEWFEEYHRMQSAP